MFNIKHLRKMMEGDEQKKLLNQESKTNHNSSSYSFTERFVNFFAPSTIQPGMSNEETFEKIRAVTKT